jgi:hypothetical protein
MSNFKQKPNKHKYVIVNDTLDSLYKDKQKYFRQQENEKIVKQKKLEVLRKKLEKIDNGPYFTGFIDVRTEILNNIEKLEEEIDSAEKCDEKIDFYSQLHEKLFTYYGQTDKIDEDTQININEQKENNDNNENNDDNEKKDNVDDWDIDVSELFKNDKLDRINELSMKNRKTKKTTRQRIKNIETLKKNNNKKNVFDYIGGEIVDENNVDLATIYNDCKILLGLVNGKTINNFNCVHCNIEMQTQMDGLYACPECGDSEQFVVENDTNNYKDPVIEKPTSPYQRKNHFCEWLNAIQGKETVDISDKVIDSIHTELKRKHIKNILTYETDKFRKILQNLRLNSLYNHVTFIKLKITGKTLLTFTREEEKHFKKMFNIIQEPYEEFCPPSRINFLSYPYVLKKFCELLKKNNYVKYLPILKRKKLIEHDVIWKKMTKKIGWKFIPSV